jgi:hypothetical protein
MQAPEEEVGETEKLEAEPKAEGVAVGATGDAAGKKKKKKKKNKKKKKPADGESGAGGAPGASLAMPAAPGPEVSLRSPHWCFPLVSRGSGSMTRRHAPSRRVLPARQWPSCGATAFFQWAKCTGIAIITWRASRAWRRGIETAC